MKAEHCEVLAQCVSRETFKQSVRADGKVRRSHFNINF